MAKNIMVSNEVYERLKGIRENNPGMSYSDAIKSLEGKRKTVSALREALLKLKVRKDDKKIEREIRKGWARWTKKYA